MAARVYMVTMKNATIVGANTLAFINPGASQGFRVLRAWCSQYGTATSQQLGVQLSTQVTAFPTLTSATPAKLSTGDPASNITGGTAGAAGTAGVNASAEGAGAKTVLVVDSFNNLNGWIWVPTPDEQIIMPAGASSGLGLFLISTPTTLTSWNAGITYQEL